MKDVGSRNKSKEKEKKGANEKEGSERGCHRDKRSQRAFVERRFEK